ncbi:MAG: hypothetical protein O7G86_10130, partial [Gammaproteobacteria bacterium]|nr:hypothetical protein [Gammaproteobacteria bacterium]
SHLGRKVNIEAKRVLLRVPTTGQEVNIPQKQYVPSETVIVSKKYQLVASRGQFWGQVNRLAL